MDRVRCSWRLDTEMLLVPERSTRNVRSGRAEEAEALSWRSLSKTESEFQSVDVRTEVDMDKSSELLRKCSKSKQFDGEATNAWLRCEPGSSWLLAEVQDRSELKSGELIFGNEEEWQVKKLRDGEKEQDLRTVLVEQTSAGEEMTWQLSSRTSGEERGGTIEKVRSLAKSDTSGCSASPVEKLRLLALLLGFA